MILRRQSALLVSLLLAFLVAGCQPPRVLRGELSGDLFWQGTVYLSGDVTLLPDSHLQIAPGSRVLFLPPGPGEDSLQDHPNFPGSELIVRGTLVADGLPAEPITFAAADPEAPAGSWGGINLSGSPGSRFRNCIFRQADSALHSQESTLLVENSLFDGNLVGIRFFGSAIRIEHNLLRNNGTAIRFHYGAPRIRGNRLVGNVRGIFITAAPRDYLITGNEILASHEFSVVLGEEVPEDVELGGNFWRSRDPAVIRRCFFDHSRFDYLGRVLIEPCLVAPIAGAGPSWSR